MAKGKFKKFLQNLTDNKFFGMFRGDNSFKDWFFDGLNLKSIPEVVEDSVNTLLGTDIDLSDSIDSLVAKYTGSELTRAEREQNVFNAEQASLARADAAEQAQLNRDFQERFYQQYQSPQAMVSQYQQAGLNPAMMFGSSGSVGSASVSPSQPSSPSASSASPSQLDLSSLLHFALAAKKNSAEIALLNSEAEKNNVEAEHTRTENSFLPELLRQQISESTERISNIHSLTELYDAEVITEGSKQVNFVSEAKEHDAKTLLLGAELIAQNISNEYMPLFNQLQLDLGECQKKLFAAQTAENWEKVNLYKAQEAELFQRGAKEFQEAVLASVQYDLVKAQTNLTDEEARRVSEDINRIISSTSLNEANVSWIHTQEDYMKFMQEKEGAIKDALAKIYGNNAELSSPALQLYQDAFHTFANMIHIGVGLYGSFGKGNSFPTKVYKPNAFSSLRNPYSEDVVFPEYHRYR